jgi:hypothetical protein
MSTQTNTDLLERTQQVLDEAYRVQEAYTSTTAGGILDTQIAQVVKDIDENDLENLYKYSLPVLTRTTAELDILLDEEDNRNERY